MIILLSIVIPIGFLAAYQSGFLTISQKKAIVFIGSLGAGSTQSEAVFTSCSGNLHRVLRFHKTGSVQFLYHGEITKGIVELIVFDQSKIPLAILSTNNPSATLEVQKRGKYYLCARFQDASGSYILNWNID